MDRVLKRHILNYRILSTFFGTFKFALEFRFPFFQSRMIVLQFCSHLSQLQERYYTTCHSVMHSFSPSLKRSGSRKKKKAKRHPQLKLILICRLHSVHSLEGIRRRQAACDIGLSAISAIPMKEQYV